MDMEMDITLPGGVGLLTSGSCDSYGGEIDVQNTIIVIAIIRLRHRTDGGELFYLKCF